MSFLKILYKSRTIQLLLPPHQKKVMDNKPLSIQYINDVLSKQPLEALEYCQRWVEIPPEEPGIHYMSCSCLIYKLKLLILIFK